MIRPTVEVLLTLVDSLTAPLRSTVGHQQRPELGLPAGLGLFSTGWQMRWLVLVNHVSARSPT